MLKAASGPGRRGGKLLTISANGEMASRSRRDLATLFDPGDVVVANDAATLPASLQGIHGATGKAIEVRLAGWVAAGDPRRFVAVAFGAGDHRTRTEDRPAPPPLIPGDRLALGPLAATVDGPRGDHPRLFRLRFLDERGVVVAGLARHGRPIQYAHVPAPLAVWDTWTSIAADPVAFEPPSAGFALDWGTVAAWRQRGVRVVTLTHAAGISSTGDPALDARLPLDEPYCIPHATATAINGAKAAGGRIIAIGTTAVRALESAADGDGWVPAGNGVATGRLSWATPPRVVDSILSGVHQRGESHFDLLGAFAHGETLNRAAAVLAAEGYRAHEFGDSVLIEGHQLVTEPSGRRRRGAPPPENGVAARIAGSSTSTPRPGVSGTS